MKAVLLGILLMAPVTSHPAEPLHDGYAIITPVTSQRTELAQAVYRRIHSATIGEGLQELLADTGYRLAHPSVTDPELPRLLSQPYPEHQRQLGPETLRETLRRLAGPAWQLVTDPLNRLVSFEIAPVYRSHPSNTPVPARLSGREDCQTLERDLTVPWARRYYWCYPDTGGAAVAQIRQVSNNTHRGKQCHMHY